MKNYIKQYSLDFFIFLAAVALIAFVSLYTHDKLIIIISLSVLIVAALCKLIYVQRYAKKLFVKSRQFSQLLDVESSYAFENLRLACCLIESDGNVLWFNSTFAKAFNLDHNTSLANIKNISRVKDLEKLKSGNGFKFRLGKTHFSVNSSEIPLSDNETDYLLYFFDETDFVNLKRKYHNTRPVIILTLIDNSDDIYEKFKESECAAVYSIIEQKIENWATGYGAVCRKYSNSRMLIIAEEKSLSKMITGKFEILEEIRTLTYSGIPVDVSLSIGIGKGGTLTEITDYARQALDMSQSRGGDQVSIKDEQNYKFFGGISEGKEQKNKVKTRFIAKSIADLIRSSSNVIVMGHRFSDFDAFGSATGIFCLAKHLEIPSHIVVDRGTTLAGSMIDQYIAKFGFDVVVSESRAKSLIEENTLLIIVDTHKRDFCEFPELVDACRKRVVIDHHRKSVGFIEDTVMFYHRPVSSSASEMVTEILQYVESKPFLDPVTAQALFAGIMLDTRNFVLRCGVRTFEAAAYLKGCNANTVAAKKLFSSDMELFRLRNAVIDNAVKYRNVFAISFADFENKNIRLITSQAADEMLNIQNVKASFVLFKDGSGTAVSARSYGETNVQLIMESLGGGGHQAMSACRLEDTDIDKSIELLHEAIDKYIEEN